MSFNAQHSNWWIFGVGSPHGDDRFGWEVAERLRPCAPARVNVRAVASPLDILHALPTDSPSHILLIDACEMAENEGPGGLVELAGDQLTGRLHGTHSTHAISIADLVELARNLQLPVVNWYFLGYTKKMCQIETPLSPQAHNAVVAAVARAIQIVSDS